MNIELIELTEENLQQCFSLKVASDHLMALLDLDGALLVEG